MDATALLSSDCLTTREGFQLALCSVYFFTLSNDHCQLLTLGHSFASSVLPNPLIRVRDANYRSLDKSISYTI